MGRKPRATSSSPVAALHAEIDSINQRIEMLHAERAAIERVVATFSHRASATSSTRAPMSAAVIRLLSGASDRGMTMAEIVATACREHPAWKPNSVKTVVYRLTQDGHLLRDNDIWKIKS